LIYFAIYQHFNFLSCTKENNNKNGSIQLDSKPIFAKQFANDLGEIIGVTISIRGFRIIKYFNLTDRRNNRVFSRDFSK